VEQTPGGFASWGEVSGILQGILDLHLHGFEGPGQACVAFFEYHHPKNTKNPSNRGPKCPKTKIVPPYYYLNY